MSLLARATKGIDQEAMAAMPGAVYVPLENRQILTDAALTNIDSALNIATFYACVRVLSESIASLPLFLYRRLPNGGKERAADHELYSTLHDAPNPAMTSFVWRELLVSHMASWGDHFSEKVYDGFGNLQLWPIRPDRLDVRWAADGSKRYDYLSPAGSRTTLDPGSVFHVPALSSNGLRGYSPVALHRRTLEVHNAAREFGRSTFRNNARPAVILEHPKTLSEAAIGRLAGQMDELRGSGNAGKTVVLEEGLTVHEVGIPPKDAQYIETRVHEAREIQKIFRMPPHMVGDLERATFSNIEHQGIEFVVYTLRPWLVRIEQEIKAQLLADEPDIFAEFLVDGLLRGDAVGRAQALQIQRQNGIINGDEWREVENKNPIEDGSGQEYWMPVNFQLALTDQPEVVDPNAPPQLVAVKSASSVNCPDCGHLLGKATPPYELRCRWCKKVVSQGAPVEAIKSADPMLMMAEAMTVMANREQPAALPQEIHVDARQEPPVVNMPQPEPVAPAQITVNVPEQPAPVVNVTVRVPQPKKPATVRKDVERDAKGLITTVWETPDG